MRKTLKCINIILVFIMLFSMLCVTSEAASVFENRKKSIYLVLDDSGSMGGVPTFDANYSLQTLVAMTDKNDSLKLYFLNDNSGLSGNLNMAGKSNAMIADIRSRYPVSHGGTPYDAVKMAQRELSDSVTQNDNTDYWLVVFTDGEFGGVDVGADLKAYAQAPLANSTLPNVLYIATGGVNPVYAPDVSNLYSVSHTSVIEAMDEAARIISNRVEISNVSYSANNSEISFSLPYPARNVVVFTQNSKTNIVNYSSKSALNISENYTVSYPAPSRHLSDSTVCFITETGGKSIGSGDVSLTFDKALVAENTTVLFEPAIGISAHFYNQDGQETDPLKLSVGEKATVKYSLCDSETKQPIDDSAFGGTVSYSAVVNGQSKNGKEFEFDVDKDTLDLEFQVTLPDGYVMTTKNSYNNLKVRKIITFSLSNGGNFKADYSKLNEAEGIEANILINGNPPTPEQMKDFKLKISGENGFVSNFSVDKLEKEGKFIIHPKKGWISVATPKSKTYEVVLKDKDGSTYSADLKVEIPGKRPWFELLLILLCIAFVIYMIAVFVTKKYFPRNTLFIVFTYALPGRNHTDPDHQISMRRAMWLDFKHRPGKFLLNILRQLFLLNQSETVTLMGGEWGMLQGITLKACNGMSMYVEHPSIVRDERGKISADFELRRSNFRTKEKLKEAPLSDELAIMIDVGEVIVKIYDNAADSVQIRNRKEYIENSINL